MVPTLIGISMLVFGLMRLLPGDIVDRILGMEVRATPAQRETISRMLGLDAPVTVQYLRWLEGVIRGDLGVSLRTSLPVRALILQSVGVTAELALLAVLLSTAVAIPLGVVAAMKRGTAADLLAHGGALVGLSVPNFWLATILLLITSLYLGWHPSLIPARLFDRPLENLQQMALPVMSLSAALMAVMMRMTRSAVLEVLGHEYVRTARAKGLAERAVLIRHVLKNAAIPIITILGLQLGYLLGGTVVVEQIFGLPGIGFLIVEGIYQRDYPVVQGAVLFVALGFVTLNLIVDLIYAYVDPRIRYS